MNLVLGVVGNSVLAMLVAGVVSPADGSVDPSGVGDGSPLKNIFRYCSASKAASGQHIFGTMMVPDSSTPHRYTS